MKTYLADIIPSIQRFSKKLDDLTKLTNQHWVSLDDLGSTKTVYIFRSNSQLLIAKNGIVERASWEYLTNQSLLINANNTTYLMKHGFLDENIFALKLDSNDRYAIFINESKYDQDLNTIDRVIRFLGSKYLNEIPIPYSESKPLVKPKPSINKLKLPVPDHYMRQLLTLQSAELLTFLENWVELCYNHSIYTPIYIYQELIKRNEILNQKQTQSLDDYANWRGYDSWKIMKDHLLEENRN